MAKAKLINGYEVEENITKSDLNQPSAKTIFLGEVDGGTYEEVVVTSSSRRGNYS